MTIEGSISDIQRQPVEGGTRTMFRLRSADGKGTQVETRLDVPYNNGDVVQASGEINSDLVLTAISIMKVRQALPPQPKPFPWLWVALGGALIVIGVMAYRMSSGSPSGGSTLTVTAMDCGKSVSGASLTLTGPTGYPTPISTGKDGSHEFSGLAKGSYQITFGKINESFELDGSSPKSVKIAQKAGPSCFGSSTPVPKPPAGTPSGSAVSGGAPSGGAASGGAPSGGSTLTVRVLNCQKGPAINVRVGVGTISPKQFVNSTDPKGESVFSGLKPGTYLVAAEGGQEKPVVVNGTSPQFVLLELNCGRVP